ncbi:MAG: chitobiase/beta-hexosaminidase C-terminal domain-containing protein, partial [Candidatus Omnitrophica bacterium]|nr:chitobiase/beta-hexosaminidase C-terminal domain-containing protein [Candidatus Omnitrophota bacterium]
IYLEGPYNPSDIVTKSFTVIPSVDVPIINPNGGNHTGSVQVSLSLPAKGTGGQNAVIRYTTNGANPTSYSTAYTSPFTLGVGNHTVKARTFYTGLEPSETATAMFTVFDPSPTLDPPEFIPVARDHANSVEVTIQNFSEGSNIYYTVGDNVAPADPTTSDTLYTGPFTLGLPSGGGDFWFVRAKAFKGVEESALVPKTYSVFDPIGNINPPVFDVPSGVFDNPITVNITGTSTPPNPGIYNSLRFYNTTNGTDPVVPDPPNAGDDDVNISSPTVLKSIGSFNFYDTSTVTTATYEFKCATPTIEAMTTKGINQLGSVTVIMSSTTTGGGTTIRYATGGIEPTESSTAYIDPIVLGPGLHILKAKTYRNNFEESATAKAAFIVEETPEAPVFTDHPMSRTVDAFTDVIFTATATGVPDPTYAWYYDGMKL